MPETISLRLDDREVRRNFRRLTDREIKQWAARTINKLAFEVLDAEKAESRRAFEFAGPATERYLAGRGSFLFDRATPARLEAHIFPRPKAEPMLREHREGVTITPDSDRLTAQGRLAVPLKIVRRSGRGRVPKRLQPAVVLGPGGRGFVAGRAILQRRGRGGSSRAVSLFALIQRAKLAPRFDFYRVAKETAQRMLPAKAKREFERIRVSRGGR